MRCIARNFDRALLRGAAVILIGGVAAGCSSDLSRFKSSDFADARSTNRSVAMAPASQPYPGDVGAGLDNTYTGSISRQGGGPRPSASVGGAMRQPLPAPTNTAARAATRPVDLTAPSVARSSVQRQPIAAPSQPAPVVAAAPAPQLDRTPTGSVTRQPAQAQAPVRSGNSGDSGWSDVGGTTITVREGETAYNLSRRFGIPVAAILSANNLSSASELKAGRKIVIPTYVYSRRAPVSAPDNDARAQQQAVRQPIPNEPEPQREPQERLAVLRETPRPKPRPQGAETSNATAGTNSPSQVPSQAGTGAGGSYTVVSGDTLYGIARKTGASVANIKAANGLSDGYLRVGQTLAIPSGNVSQPTRVANASSGVDRTTTSATTREPAPVVKTSAPQATSSTQTQVAAVATQSRDVAPDSTGIGKLRWPVRGRIVSDFGSTSGSARNDGIDIAVPAGTPVKAAENGVVIYAGDGLKEFGNTVLVRHDNGMVTVYGHASALRVKRGEKVRRGQEIALSGMSGSADRPKLHFEVRKDATPVNPSGYLE
ncbi:peptidoglycan DD-metalloendopeptidase family protein [Nitratireductor rhodophyticola]|uniref:peptidoglycan DD-metalloendopeptidase family protein n=1 Tax=Nitratireductor rhodophyticola TaxID=2854036 RepID=UPI002AC8D5BA|nr:peptidoglycan DD-metalloendopeptidase family protein [Nitratireductor rhodophyticola]WPZ13312.1 peptidoglycan DD-metalloendopeptidase family protein [Nitratireductor rhodophyticola]